MTIRKKLLLSNVFIVLFPTLLVFFIGIISLFLVYGFDSIRQHPENELRVGCLSMSEAGVLISDKNYEVVPGNVAVYRNSSNEYVLAFENEADMPNETTYMQYLRRHIFFIVILVLTILLFLINRFLAIQIYKSIVTPLDILTDGVREISQGNLDYRIEYKEKDEFAPVCSAFNEMATRLSEMTLQQQREEQSRKVLIAGISHDLRTPLTSIKAYVVGFENGIAKTPAMQKKYLATINQKACELEYIINQLFLFSKLDVGDFPFLMETVNLGEELRQLVSAVRDEYEQKGVSLVMANLPTEVFCSIDIIQFGNVIQNIWSNTAKYKGKEHAVSTIICEETQQEIMISIYDDGPGVAEDALDKLFDIFYRTDTSRQNVALGSGLGLAISAKIIKSFRGTIRARNHADGGLCIDIILPKGGAE
ncbi:MAG: HAMP domain-containing sensor histidine kinase [bacterium]|nr:HAMP domain-containing sensor histidine kinase [bacterium]